MKSNHQGYVQNTNALNVILYYRHSLSQDTSMTKIVCVKRKIEKLLSTYELPIISADPKLQCSRSHFCQQIHIWPLTSKHGFWQVFLAAAFCEVETEVKTTTLMCFERSSNPASFFRIKVMVKALSFCLWHFGVSHQTTLMASPCWARLPQRRSSWWVSAPQVEKSSGNLLRSYERLSLRSTRWSRYTSSVRNEVRISQHMQMQTHTLLHMACCNNSWIFL